MQKYIFKVNFITLLLLFNIYSYVSEASALIVEEQALSFEDKSKIRKTVLDTTGPSANIFWENPKLMNSPEYRLLFNGEPFAEVKFINQYLKKEFPCENMKAHAIPVTLWDLYVVKEYLTDEHKRKYYNNLNNREGSEESISVFFDISKSISIALRDIGGFNLENYKKLAFIYLKDIKTSVNEDKFFLFKE